MDFRFLRRSSFYTLLTISGFLAVIFVTKAWSNPQGNPPGGASPTASGAISVDTTGNVTKVTVGVQGNASMLVLQPAVTDPAGTAGAVYYNQTNNVFRCYQGSYWGNCLVTPPVYTAGKLTRWKSDGTLEDSSLSDSGGSFSINNNNFYINNGDQFLTNGTLTITGSATNPAAGSAAIEIGVSSSPGAGIIVSKTAGDRQAVIVNGHVTVNPGSGQDHYLSLPLLSTSPSDADCDGSTGQGGRMMLQRINGVIKLFICDLSKWRSVDLN